MALIGCVPGGMQCSSNHKRPINWLQEDIDQCKGPGVGGSVRFQW